MARFILWRLVALVLTLLFASFVVFAALSLAPGDPIAFLTGGKTVPPETVAALKAQYHLDDPLPLAYLHWLGSALHGDFGQSLSSGGENVSTLIAPRIVSTLMLVTISSIMILVVGVGTGIVGGLRTGATDTVILTGSTIALAIPSFVAAIVLISIFGVNLGWFPVFGPGSGFFDRIYHLFLPAIALSLVWVAYVGRVTRAAVMSESRREHVQTAISRGIPYPTVVRRHVVRNALIPITTVAGLTVGGLIAGAAVVEQAFSTNGLGSYLVNAVQTKDFPVVQAIVLILVASFIIINTIVDLIYMYVDPRLRPTRQKQGSAA
ncbi:MAG: ABC transporter permease [Thermoleophilia bacterium]|nr:ABC transporter permease [Thermoleophilia bacterium]